MKKLNKCVTENCIPHQTSCGEWNGGDIEYLGICNGDSLNVVVWEIVEKLKKVAETDDLSSFDIDELLEICNQATPAEVNLVSILTILKNNNVCLKQAIDDLQDQLSNIDVDANPTANLKTFTTYDSLGNPVQLDRAEFDQLLIDNLSSHDQKIDVIEDTLDDLQNQIDNIDINPTASEASISTCVDGTSRPASQQVQIVATDYCQLKSAVGSPSDIANALSKQPNTWNTKFSLLPGWDLTPAQWAEQYGNLLLVVSNLESRILAIETNCCNITCADVLVGYSVVLNENETGLILKFTSGAGTEIPGGFTDQGSTVVVTDQNGNSETYSLVITQGLEEEIDVSLLDLTGPLNVKVTAKHSNGTVSCEKDIERTVNIKTKYCTISNNTSTDIVLLYETTVNQ